MTTSKYHKDAQETLKHLRRVSAGATPMPSGLDLFHRATEALEWALAELKKRNKDD